MSAMLGGVSAADRPSNPARRNHVAAHAVRDIIYGVVVLLAVIALREKIRPLARLSVAKQSG